MVIERVNISCFIYSNMPLDKCAVFTDFERENETFIGFTKKAMNSIEKFYHVEIPLAEIKYIYLYVKNDENK